MEPEQFSKLKMYGNKSVFEKRLGEGYTEVASGSGERVENFRIVGLFAFYHPSQRVATLESPKLHDGEHTVRCQQFEGEYSGEEFEKYCAERKITLGEKRDLAQILQDWE